MILKKELCANNDNVIDLNLCSAKLPCPLSQYLLEYRLPFASIYTIYSQNMNPSEVQA